MSDNEKKDKPYIPTEDPENFLQRPDEFDPDFLDLYMNEPFLGTISAETTKIADPVCKTAYIGFRRHDNGEHEIVLGYNPKFFRNLVINSSRNERRGVLKHELYHFVFQHIFSRIVSEKNDQRLWNFATDLSIDSLIGADNLPDFCLMPGRRPQVLTNKNPKDPNSKEVLEPAPGPIADFIEKAQKDQASDYYFDELKKIRDEEQKKNGGAADINVIFGGVGTLDDHDGWGNIDPEIMEEIRNKVNGLLDKAVKRADRDNSWGSVPQSIQEVIRKMINHEIDWRSVIKNFVGRSRSVERNSTIKKINKKVPYVHPGVRRPLVADFVCFIDQSGSMSDEDIALLFGTLKDLSELVSIDTYHFDTEIDMKSHRKWKKSDPFPTVLRTRCGGTDFQCCANFLNDAKNRGRWSGTIILTDGYAPRMGSVNGVKVLWVVTPTGTTEHIREGDLVCRMSKDQGQFKRY